MILKANNLIKTYGGKSVVNDVSLNLKQGEIVGLLGPNNPTISPCLRFKETSFTTLLPL